MFCLKPVLCTRGLTRTLPPLAAQPISNSPQMTESEMHVAFRAIAHRSASRTFTTGAPVIYMKNLPEEFLVNGSRGQIIGFAEDGAWGESLGMGPGWLPISYQS